MRVFIAGKGIISAIGNDVNENRASLLAGKSGIRPITILATEHAATLPAGEIKFTNKELAAIAGFNKPVTRTALLSMIAAKEAIEDLGVKDWQKYRTGFISANTVGGMDLTENFAEAFLKDNTKGRLTNVVNHDSGSVTALVANALGISGFVTTISTACSSSANAIMYASRLIKNNVLDIAIAGGTDCMLRFTLNGFNALGILDKSPCTPFDENRNGLNLGEGAAYVVLVSEKVMKVLGKEPSVELTGYGNANDAYHQTASSAEGNGNYQAMVEALAMSGLRAEDISYINLHGTGTKNNDVSEGTAIARIFKDKMPAVSSTKAYTGHTLGASGAIEAVFSVLAIEDKTIFPNLRFQTQMKELGFAPVTSVQQNVQVKNVLSNSFGFGGNCSSLIFSAV